MRAILHQELKTLDGLDLRGRHGSATGFRVGHWPFLDGIRGMGILCVISVHAQLPWLPGGYAAVDVFFVLSGFLITVLLLKEWDQTGSISLKKFFARRALRLLPALTVYLIVSCVYSYFFQDAATFELYYKGALVAFFYMTNWVWAYNWFPLVFGHTWTLSLEEQFYFLWPPTLLCLLHLKTRRRWKLLFVVAGIVASITLRAVLVQKLGWGQMRAHGCTDTRADGLLEGCLLGMLVYWYGLPKAHWARIGLRIAFRLAVAYLIIHVLFIELGPFYLPYGLTLLTLASTILIAGLLDSPPGPMPGILESSVLVWLGRRSYGLYLWHVQLIHFPLPLVGLPKLPGDAPAEMALRLALTFLIASVSYSWIEQPCLRMKARWSVVDPQPGDHSAAHRSDTPATQQPADPAARA